MAGPRAEAPPRQEWWERLRDRTSRSRIFLALRRVRAVAAWFALLVVLVAVAVSPTVRTALGAWIGCLSLVVCWFTLARAKTVSWALTSGVFASGMPLALLIAMVSLWVCSAAGVIPSDIAASVAVASVVEEVLKLTPLAVLALVAPGRVRRFLVSDWIVLGVAAGAAFETVEEVTRRVMLLNSSNSFLNSLFCPEGGRQLECGGATTYSLSPFSGVTGDIFPYPYAGHAVVTGLVGGAIGLGIALWRRGRVHRGGYRAALQLLAPAVPLWTWWVAVVDHMGRNASNDVLWSLTGGEAPSWPVEVTASLTNNGHGRGATLLLMLALAWVIDSRTLWSGGYVSALESENYGNRWAPWRWRVWAGVPRNALGRFLADGACLVSVVGVEWRWAWMTLMEAAAFREPRLLLATPAKLRIAREEAARAELDPAPEQWWRVRLGGLCAVVAGVLVIAMVPDLTRSLADSLTEEQPYWLAGILDALGAAWESLSWEKKLGLVVLAGSMVVLSGGTLGLAFEVGMGVATALGSARGAASLVRDPRGTAARYLSTHTPTEIALDLATAALTTVGGGAASAMGGQMARGAYAATREARYASWLWRTDRTAWRQYVRNARRLARDETGAANASMWSPRNGLRHPGLRTPRPGRSDGGLAAMAVFPGGKALRGADYAAAEASAAGRYAKDIPELFRQREPVLQAKRASRKRLKDAIPKKYPNTDFTRRQFRKKTIPKLRREGYSAREIEQLDTLVDEASKTHKQLTDAGAKIGEAGGEKYLTEQGYHIPEEFRADNVAVNNGTAPGGWVDGMAISPNGDEMVVSEYKGVSAQLSRNPVETRFEGKALQGTPAYARDHMLSDPRFAQYFHDHPDVWEGVKSGQIRMNAKTIYTKTPDRIVVEDQPFSLTPEVTQALQQAIDKIP